MADSDSTTPDKKRQQPPPIEFLKPGESQAPQQQPERPAAAWVTRPEDYQRPQYQQPATPPQAQPTGPGNRARAAGVLLILAAAISAGGFVLSIVVPPSVSDFINATNNTSLYALSEVCSVLVVWGQAIMALAGIMAYQRINWRMAMSCAFFAMLMIGGFALAYLDPVSIGAAFIGVLGFVLTVTSRPEFRS